ncbi:hypothetical protein FGO68_gene9551 [Halteria grandinella]|uniref:Uncharacterized protein n=1 Tax=Halteria grandinella TaxID=5974 RepID=A0A8J8NBM8_HALGN|nr:hypothetical protein FGO68_gene9551 [Halteria grandinella]
MIQYETVSTQLEEALKKIDEQQELLYQLQRQYEHAVKKKDSYKESATKARERNATLSQEYIKLQATVNKRNLQSQEYQNDENMSQNIPNQLVTFNAGKSITRSTKSGEIQQLKPPKQSYHHPMSTKVFKKTFELDATTSCDVNPDQESVKQLGATFPTQDKARQGDFSGLTDQHLSQRRHNPMTFESEGENSRVLQRVDEGSSSESDETTEGMGVKSKGMLRDQINFYQKKLQRLLI